MITEFGLVGLVGRRNMSICGPRMAGRGQIEVKEVARNTCAAVARVIPAPKRLRYELQLEAPIANVEARALSKSAQP